MPRCIEALKPLDRRLVDLYYIKGSPFREVCACSPGDDASPNETPPSEVVALNMLVMATHTLAFCTQPTKLVIRSGTVTSNPATIDLWEGVQRKLYPPVEVEGKSSRVVGKRRAVNKKTKWKKTKCRYRGSKRPQYISRGY